MLPAHVLGNARCALCGHTVTILIVGNTCCNSKVYSIVETGPNFVHGVALRNVYNICQLTVRPVQNRLILSCNASSLVLSRKWNTFVFRLYSHWPLNSKRFTPFAGPKSVAGGYKKRMAPEIRQKYNDYDQTIMWILSWY